MYRVQRSAQIKAGKAQEAIQITKEIARYFDTKYPVDSACQVYILKSATYQLAR